MPDNDRNSSLMTEIWGEQAKAMKDHYPKKVSRDWETMNRLSNYLMGKGDKSSYPVRVKSGVKGLHHRWDVDTTEDPGALQDWTASGDLVLHEHAETQRMEMGFYDWNYAVEVSELQKEQMGGINALRDFTKQRLGSTKAHVLQSLNQQFATGSGAAQEKGDGGYQIFGYQTLLATSISGTYGNVARSGNTFLQHKIIDGDGGTNSDWEDDCEERIEKALDTATVDIDGREYSPNIGLTSRAALHNIRQNVHTRERIINHGMGESLKLGAGDIIVRGVPIMYDNTISDATKKLFLLDTKAWLLRHGFKNLTDFYMKELTTRQGQNVAHIFRGRVQLICERHRPNAVIYWA